MKKLALIIALIVWALPSFAGEVTLRWDANTEPDLAGYKLYYKIDGPGEPYDGTISDQGPSPIDVGNTTQFTITGLPDLVAPERYRFVVTAYDNEQTDPPGGMESGYSNEVDTDGVPTSPKNLVKVKEEPQ